MDPEIHLAPGVIAVQLGHVEAKATILTGPDRVLVFDAGSSRSEGELMRQLASRASASPLLLAYSHGHWDHARGGIAFGGTDAVCHEAAVAMVRDQLSLESSADPARGPLSAHELPGAPTRWFTGSEVLDLGGRRVELRSTPGHSPGAAVLWDPESGTLCTGDTAVTSIPPVFRDGDSLELESSLRRLAELPAERLVPGHGAIVEGRDRVVATLTGLADYLAEVRANVEELLDAGTPVARIADRVVDVDAAVRRFDGPAERTIERHRNAYRDMAAESSRRRADS